MTFEDFIEEWHNEQEFIKVQTSGSTGNPKIIELSKDFMVTSGQRTNSFFNINQKSRLHSCISPDFIGGKMMAVRADIANAKLTWEMPSNEPLKGLRADDVLDLVAVVPSQMIYILDNIEKMPKIKNIIIGGSPIHPDLKKKIAESGLNAYETYGMTETSSHIALRKISQMDYPFTTLNGIKVNLDSIGCLKILFENGLEIQTHDIAELISPISFYIKGRIDDIIITGGKKLNPNEIENKISHLINSPFCITGFPDKKWGEKVILLIEGYQDEWNLQELKENLKETLVSWEIPKEIYFIKEFSRTTNGKIKRPKSL